jgi:hypothetical protein
MLRYVGFEVVTAVDVRITTICPLKENRASEEYAVSIFRVEV